MEAIQWQSVFFLVFALAACLLAVAVVLSNNIVRMAFYLVMCLGAVSGLFFLAGADFLAAMQLMVYVGGTLVLLAFGVMLTARGPFVSMKTGAGQWVMAVLVGAALLVVLLQTVTSVPAWKGPSAPAEQLTDVRPATTTPLGMGLLGLRTEVAPPTPGQPAATGYLLVFEILSVHLLVVLVGAAYLARARRRVGRTSVADQPTNPIHLRLVVEDEP